MPGLSRFELATRMLEIRPDVPVIMTSGCIRPEDEERAKACGVTQIIGKPNTVEECAQMLDDLFRNPQPNRETRASQRGCSYRIRASCMLACGAWSAMPSIHGICRALGRPAKVVASRASTLRRP